MNINSFWKLIDKTQKNSNSDPFKQANLLIDELAQLSEEDILQFDSIFMKFIDHAYIVDLWEAAYVIGCGCSDDGFMDFRAWLVGQGEKIFKKALNDPESLLDVVETGWETQEGNLLYVARHAYELKTGKNMPQTLDDSPKLKGKPSADESSILTRYPKLAKKFWNKCKEDFET